MDCRFSCVSPAASVYGSKKDMRPVVSFDGSNQPEKWYGRQRAGFFHALPNSVQVLQRVEEDFSQLIDHGVAADCLP